MTELNTKNDHEENGCVPLNVLLRRRREELSLRQADVGEALHLTAEAVGQWEGGHRRMELNKLPRIAAVLQLDAKQLCIQAIAEFHPAVHAVLFGPEDAASQRGLPLAS